MFEKSTVNLREINVNLSKLSTSTKLAKICYATFPVLESRDYVNGKILSKIVEPNYIHLPA